MAHADGIITAPINTDDVIATIGENSHDVGTLCMSSKINPIAKYKPVRGGDYSTSLKTDANLWKSTDGNCGLNPYEVEIISDVPEAYNNSDRMNGWEYLHPLSNNYKRLSDFDGYDHNAYLASILCATEAFTTEKAWQIILSGPNMSSWIRFEDMATVSNGYLGVYAVCESSSKTPFYVTSQQKISENNRVHECTIDWSNNSGTWILYPIFCAKPNTQYGTEQIGQRIYTIPLASPHYVSVTDTTSVRLVRAMINKIDSDTIRLVVTAVNSMASPCDFGTVFWRVQKNETLQNYDKNGTWIAGTIAGNSSNSAEVILTGCQELIQQGYAWVIAYSGNTAATIGDFKSQIFLSVADWS